MEKVTKPQKFPIQPSHIDASKHLFDSFGNRETEVSAGWIIRFFQERGESWSQFTYDDINAFYSKKHKDGFTFNRLISHGWIIADDNGNYYVTDDFITRCFRSSPNY